MISHCKSLEGAVGSFLARNNVGLGALHDPMPHPKQRSQRNGPQEVGQISHLDIRRQLTRVFSTFNYSKDGVIRSTKHDSDTVLLVKTLMLWHLPLNER